MHEVYTMTRVEAKAEGDDEGGILVEMNTQRSESTYLLTENSARRLLIDLIHATDMETPEDE